MLPYRPASSARLGTPIRLSAEAVALVPPPLPDMMITGYEGLGGFIESAAILSVLAAASWAGIRTGMGASTKTLKAAGWIGGIGSGLLGVMYLGAKSGLHQVVGLPTLRVSPV